jgi:HEAT repeat protein
MALLNDAFDQARILAAYGAMLSGRPDRIAEASRTLSEAGPAARWCLRRLAQQRENSPARIEAAVLLHKLDDPGGVEALQAMLRWGQGVHGDRDALSRALVRIGPPDAIDMTLAIWPALVQSGDPAAQRTVCRAWAEMRDPRALEALVATCEQIPGIFGETAAAFGEQALPALERLLSDPWALRRHLCVEAIGLIPCHRSFQLLTERLKDPDPDLRQHTAAALAAGFGPKLLVPALDEAIRSGCSSPQAVALIVRYQPPALLDRLESIVQRWHPGAPTTGDTEESVEAALVGIASLDPARVAEPIELVRILCALQSRRPGPRLAPHIARALARWATDPGAGEIALPALAELLTETDADTRATAAECLERLGEPAGTRFLAVLESNRPVGRMIGSIQTLLRGGPDANVAARDTVRQLGRWVSRISQVAAQRLSPEAGAAPDPMDPRTADMLRRLLVRALETWEAGNGRSPSARSGMPPAETMDRVSLCVAAARGLAADAGPPAPETLAALSLALRLVRMGAIYEEGGAGALRHSQWREVGEPVRAAAAEALLARLGGLAFSILIENLYYPSSEVRTTSLAALGRLGDVRALAHVEPIAAQPEHPLNSVAVAAVAAIRHTHPEMMVLLRPSESASPDELLRPASGGNDDISGDELLRPADVSPEPDSAG